jgi:hypothetical protein
MRQHEYDPAIGVPNPPSPVSACRLMVITVQELISPLRLFATQLPNKILTPLGDHDPMAENRRYMIYA